MSRPAFRHPASCRPASRRAGPALLLAALLSVPGVWGVAQASPMPSAGSPTPATPAAPAVSPARAKLIEGLKAVQKGDLAGGEKLLEEAAKLDPKDADALLSLADIAVMRKKPQAVEGYLKRAAEADPRNVRVPIAWSRYYVLRNDLPKAEDALKQAVSLDPKSYHAHIEYGDFLLNGRGDGVAAEREFRAASLIDPRNAAAFYGLGNAYVSQKKPDDAIRAFEQSAKLNPANPAPPHAIGRVLAGRGQYDQAIVRFDQALKIAPAFAPAILDKGSTLEMKGDAKGAVAQFEQAVKVAPRFAVAHVKLGAAYQRLKRYDEAEKAYAKALEIQPENVLALNNLAWLAAERRMKLDQALAWARKASDLAPQAPHVSDTLGYVYLARKEPQNAIAAFRQAVALSAGAKPVPSYVYRLGVAYAEAGQKNEAIEQLKRSLGFGVDFPEKGDAQKRLRALGG